MLSLIVRLFQLVGFLLDLESLISVELDWFKPDVNFEWTKSMQLFSIYKFHDIIRSESLNTFLFEWILKISKWTEPERTSKNQIAVEHNTNKIFNLDLIIWQLAEILNFRRGNYFKSDSLMWLAWNSRTWSLELYKYKLETRAITMPLKIVNVHIYVKL